MTAWYGLSAEDVATQLGVDPATGLTAAEAASRLAKNGPNALAAEKSTPGWQRFLNEYASYMQLILAAAGAVSIVIGELRTGLVLLLLTVLNATIGLKQKGKAESAMNALKSMLMASARVRRDGAEAQIPADQVVVGDVVLISAGDQVAADGRIVSASSLQIDESSLTGESVPASKDATAVQGDSLSPGDQSDMAFMNTPVTHGSGGMIVTGTGSDTEVGKISGDADVDEAGEDPARPSAQHDDPVDRGPGRRDDDRHVRHSDWPAANPAACCSSRQSRWRSRRSRRRCRR